MCFGFCILIYIKIAWLLARSFSFSSFCKKKICLALIDFIIFKTIIINQEKVFFMYCIGISICACNLFFVLFFVFEFVQKWGELEQDAEDEDWSRVVRQPRPIILIIVVIIGNRSLVISYSRAAFENLWHGHSDSVFW